MSGFLFSENDVKNIYLEVIIQFPEEKRKGVCEELIKMVKLDADPEVTPYQPDDLELIKIEWQIKMAKIKLNILEELYKMF
jgi:hypothetical protein